MGKILILLLFITATAVQAQHTDTSGAPMMLKQLPRQGVLLYKGWKFHSGDNPAYADPAYDDHTWQPIDPTKDIHDLPQLRKGIGWFRLKLHLDTALFTHLLSLVIQQSGASEIYVNGQLLSRLGTISNQPNLTVAYDPLAEPIPLRFIKSGVNVLAVRYSLQPYLFYTRIMGRQNPALSTKINTLETALYFDKREAVRSVAADLFIIGAFVLLFILHMAFYLYYPVQKANLYFSLFALLGVIGSVVETNHVNEVKYVFYYFNALADIGHLTNFFLLTALYFLLNQKKGWIYWCLLALTLLGIVLNAAVYGIGFGISELIIRNLINLEIVRIAIRAVANKQRGAWLIASGAIGYFVIWIAFLLTVLSGNNFYYLGETFTLGDLLYAMAFLSIPIVTSVFLALDFAFTSRSLQQKLVEVKELAHRNLAQEQEKQQILASQKETLELQVTERTAALHQSLNELKATQAQLVQREKMASLGELVGGIAHEIQNPLNFVNNFSEVSKELAEEIKQQINSGHVEEAKEIAEDVINNLDKVVQHGKRADSIVKSMLQHARTHTGEKQPTDLNALVDEYLRLSYHGVHAKDKTLEVELQSSYDDTIGKITIVPQDIGRVLLNLFNNAFYATAEKKKRSDDAYQPLVSVRTRRENNMVKIQVTDNGTGIPKAALQRIFQPFFTTKPTGEGTGLGLSLSYDIITKGHGGELAVQSVEGDGATFIVRLPT